MAKECEVTSKTYKEIRVIPAAARISGQMEAQGTYSETLGFYLTATTLNALGAFDPAQLSTAIIDAEIVTVTKKSAEVWVAGDAIFWLSATTEFTNVDDGLGLLVGKAKVAAATGDATGDIVLKDYYPVQRGLQLGSTQIPWKITAAFPDPIISLYAVSAVVGNIESLKVHTVLQGIGATGGRALFSMATEVALGGWANALKAITDFGVAGEVAGLASAFCAEMILPSTAPSAGNYAPLEVELRVPNGAGLGAKTSFIHIEAQAVGGSTGLTLFQTSGYFMSINGVTSRTDGLFEEINASGVTQFDAVLRISVDGIPYFIGLCDDKAFT